MNAFTQMHSAVLDAFRAALKIPRPALILLGYVVLSTAFTLLWLSKTDLGEVAKSVMAETEAWQRLSSQQQMGAVEAQASMGPVLALAGSLVPACVAALIGALYWFGYRLLCPPGGDFAKFLAATGLSFLAVDLVRLPLTGLTLWLTENWNVHPQRVLLSNMAPLIGRGRGMEPLYVLLESIDLFGLGGLYLFSVAIAVASGRSVRETVPWTIGGWLLVVGMKAGVAFVVSP